MSVAAQNLVTNSGTRLCFYPINFHGHPLKNPSFIASRHRRNHLHFEVLGHKASLRGLESLNTGRCRLRVFESEGTVHRDGLHKHNFDAFLSVAEVLCLVPSAALSIGIAVNWTFSSSQKQFMEALLNRVFAWQFVMLVGAVAIGALIRKRQWGRICRDSFKSGGTDFNLIERIEKLEEDLRSSAAIIRVLSRQLEKLGIRFRVTRKALKEPITEAAALAQKNSEATQALAEQEDILEKELGEIQKVLLAMQEQQQKQLVLIVAIGKAGKLRESNREVVVEEETIKPCNPVLEETKQVEILTGVGHIGTDNDRA